MALLMCHITDWHFNAPNACHRGAVWARIIKTVKRLLTKIIQEQITGEDALLKYVVKVELTVNG